MMKFARTLKGYSRDTWQKPGLSGRISKVRVKDFWERNPCGSKDAASLPEGSPEFFEAVEHQRFHGDDFMRTVVGFNRWTGKNVLEVGCGLGTDLLQFARGGNRVFGVDLTEKGVKLTAQRLSFYGYKGFLCAGDAEALPFSTGYFDLVYVWGVLHHTPDPRRAVEEITRVLKPGGHVLAMVYHRYSLVALQVWLYYGLCHGKLGRSPSRLIAEHLESPGTKVFSRNEAKILFEGLGNIEVQTILTRYDTRLGRRFFLPRWVRKCIPSNLGWFLVVRADKPFPPQPLPSRGR